MIATTEKFQLKDKLVEACIQQQESLIGDFDERIDSLLHSVVLGNEDEYDRQELSQTAQNADEANSLTEQRQFAADELQFLQFLKRSQKELHTSVEPGAVVVTDHGVFYISVSIEQFFVDGDTYIGLSTKSPLYQEMKGKGEGDIFAFAGLQYTIEEIF